MKPEEIIKEYSLAYDKINEVSGRILLRTWKSIPVNQVKRELHNLVVRNTRYYYVLYIFRENKRDASYLINSVFTFLKHDFGGQEYIMEILETSDSRGRSNHDPDILRYENHFIRRYWERQYEKLPITREDYLNAFYDFVKKRGIDFPVISYLTDIDENLIFEVLQKSNAGIALGKTVGNNVYNYKTYIREDQQHELQSIIKDQKMIDYIMQANIIGDHDSLLCGATVNLVKDKEKEMRERQKREGTV